MDLSTALLLELTGALAGGALVLLCDEQYVARRRRNRALRASRRDHHPAKTDTSQHHTS